MSQKQGALKVIKARLLLVVQISMVLLLTPSVLAQNLEYTIAPFGYWSALACSADGHALAAYDYYLSGRIYTSTNSGAIWTAANPFRPGSKPFANYLALTPDASTLIVIVGFAYSSHDLGVTWKTNSLPHQNVNSVAISYDGS